MRTFGALKHATCAPAKRMWRARRPLYLPLACWSYPNSRNYRESSLLKAKCSIRRAGGMISTSMESVLVFWVMEVHRASFVCLNCARCATPLLRSQFIPIISKDPTVSVVNFARTKMWFVPAVSLHCCVAKAAHLNSRNTSHSFLTGKLRNGYLRTYRSCSASIVL